MMSDGSVLVTDAQMRSSLAVIRSLGKKGLKVTGGDETKFSTGLFSKYCSKSFIYPPPQKNPGLFSKKILENCRENQYDVLFPVADFCLEPVINIEKELSKHVAIALPKREIFEKGYDKGITLKIALDNGIPCPKTYAVSSLDEVKKLKDVLEYPAVIKPRIGSGRRGVAICQNYEEVLSSFQVIYPKHGNLLIQEFIPNGGEFGIYVLMNQDSEPRACTAQRRLRSYPYQGGASTLRESFCNKHSKMAKEFAFSLLQHMNWTGVAMVEFRIDPRDNIPKLMEVNPRFWGSLQLSILSGVDFPWLYYQMLIEGDIQKDLNYDSGIQCRWLLPGDILWYLTTPEKLKNLSTFLKFKNNYDIVSLEDPGPTLGFTAATMCYIFDKDMWELVRR